VREHVQMHTHAHVCACTHTDTHTHTHTHTNSHSHTHTHTVHTNTPLLWSYVSFTEESLNLPKDPTAVGIAQNVTVCGGPPASAYCSIAKMRSAKAALAALRSGDARTASPPNAFNKAE
jgi:hypothetical protein